LKKQLPIYFLSIRFEKATSYLFYLGRELAKAELSLLSDTKYFQDQAQGELCYR